MTAAVASPVEWALCHRCRCGLPDEQDLTFCADCEISDCRYCSTSMPRPLLSEQLACRVCSGDGS